MRAAAAVILLLAMAAAADATVIGVSPAKLEYRNIARGQTQTGYLTASTTDEGLRCSVSTFGEASEWIRLEDPLFTIPASGQHRFPVAVTVPDGVPNGVYHAVIEVRTARNQADVGGTGVNVNAAIYINTMIEVAGSEGRWFKVMNVTVSNANAGQPVKTEVQVKNNAARPVTPTISLRMTSRDKGRTYASTSLSRDSVEPLERKTITANIPSTGMEPDLYNMEVTVTIDGENAWASDNPFYLIPEGAKLEYYKLEGALEDATITNANMTLGEKAAISADFRNTGEAPVYAVLRADIISNGSVISAQKSPGEYVEPGRTARMTVEYQPSAEGEYVTRIWVEYSGIRTAVREARIAAWKHYEPKFNIPVNFTLMAVILVAAVASWLGLYWWKYHRRD